MKKLIVAAALGLSAISMSSFAANATDSVPITINLAPICQITTPGTLTFEYESFQTGQTTATGGAFTIKCTTSLSYKVGFDATAAPAVVKPVGAGVGNLQLAYDLGLSGTTSGNGTGNTPISLFVTGTMALGQSGTCATASMVAGKCTSTSETHAIYVVY
jgi:hypothetical protein